VHRRFQERFGITILEGYGLSETSPVATFSQAGDKLKVGSIGKPIWGVDVAVKKDDGTFARWTRWAKIVIRGHNIMKGYYNRPEATREAIVNGWFTRETWAGWTRKASTTSSTERRTSSSAAA
jgi:long-chain acyl-CoA synthetase